MIRSRPFTWPPGCYGSYLLRRDRAWISFEVWWVPRCVSALLADRLYNIRMLDGALLQMCYRFQRDVVIEHRLGFFPSPIWCRLKQILQFILATRCTLI